MTVPDKIVLHPLVLLSVVDHYNRVAKDTKKRIVGVLLGETYKGQVDVTNSFAGARVIQHRHAVPAALHGLLSCRHACP